MCSSSALAYQRAELMTRMLQCATQPTGCYSSHQMFAENHALNAPCDTNRTADLTLNLSLTIHIVDTADENISAVTVPSFASATLPIASRTVQHSMGIALLRHTLLFAIVNVIRK